MQEITKKIKELTKLVAQLNKLAVELIGLIGWVLIIIHLITD